MPSILWLAAGVLIRSASIQAPPQDAEHTIVIQELKPLPAIDLKIENVIDILTEYAVMEDLSPGFCKYYYGLTDFDSRTITICGSYDMATRRKTLLHELIHIFYWQHGVFTGGPYEPFVDQKAQEIFLSLYGLH